MARTRTARTTLIPYLSGTRFTFIKVNSYKRERRRIKIRHFLCYYSVVAGLTERAMAFAARVHEGQTRRSGRPYVEHPTAVGETLEKLGLGETTVATGYLHDMLEDTDASYNDLDGEFGADATAVVSLRTASKERLKSVKKRLNRNSVVLRTEVLD